MIKKTIILCTLLFIPATVLAMKKARDLTPFERHQLIKLVSEYRKKIHLFEKQYKDPAVPAAETFAMYELELLAQARDLTKHQHDVIVNLLSW